MGQQVKIIKLDKERALLYTSDALAQIERALGGESWEAAVTQRGQTRLHAFLWGGLRHEDPELTREGIGKVITKASEAGATYNSLWTMVLDGLRKSGWVEDEERAANPTPRPAPVPGTSGD